MELIRSRMEILSWLIIQFVKPEEAADTRHPKKHRKPAGKMATEEKEEKTEVYQNKATIMPFFFRNRCQKRMV